MSGVLFAKPVVERSFEHVTEVWVIKMNYRDIITSFLYCGEILYAYTVDLFFVVLTPRSI